jgi:hypothetical protein
MTGSRTKMSNLIFVVSDICPLSFSLTSMWNTSIFPMMIRKAVSESRTYPFLAEERMNKTTCMDLSCPAQLRVSPMTDRLFKDVYQSSKLHVDSRRGWNESALSHVKLFKLEFEKLRLSWEWVARKFKPAKFSLAPTQYLERAKLPI